MATSMRLSIALGLSSSAVLAFVACGGLRDQEIVISDDPAAGTASGGKPASTGGKDSGGSSGSGANAGSGMGGEPDDGIDELPTGGAPSVDGPPTVVKVTPVDAADEVVLSTAVRIDFSEALDEATVTADDIQLFDGDRAITGKLTYQAGAVLFEPNVELSLLAEYRVEVGTGIADEDGTHLEEAFSSTFVTRDGSWAEEASFAPEYSSVWTARAAVDARGNALVVWLDNDDNVYTRWYSAKTDSWGEVKPIEGQSAPARDPAVAVSPEGDAVVMFRTTAASDQLWARRYVNGAWEAKELKVQDVPANTTFTAPPQLSFKGDKVLAVWTRETLLTGTTVGMIDAASATASGAWKVTAQLEYAPEPSKTVGGELGFTTDSAGNAIVVYGFSSNTATLYPTFMRYTASTGLWTGPAPLRQGTQPAIADNNSYYGPTIAMNDKGDAIASWITKNGVNFDIMAARFTKAGGWEAAVQLEKADGNAFQTPGNIAAHGDSFTIAWKQMVGSDFNGYRATYSGGTFSDAALLSSGSTNVWFSAPVLCGDPHGNLLASWEEGYEDAPDLAYARYDARSGKWGEPDALTKLTDTGYAYVWLNCGDSGQAIALTGTYDDVNSIYGFRAATFR